MLSILREAFLDNPLLRYRWRRASVYTWSNIFLGAGVVLSISAAIGLFLFWLDTRQYVRVLPSEVRTQFIEEHFSHPDLGEQMLFVLLFRGWLLIHAVAVLYLLRELFIARRILAPWQSDQIGVLPVTRRQIAVAAFDWPILKCIAASLIATILTSLPNRKFDIPGWMHDDFALSFYLVPAFDSILYDVILDRKFSLWPSWISSSALLFALHRTFLFISFDRWRVLNIRMLSGWIFAALLTGIRVYLGFEEVHLEEQLALYWLLHLPAAAALFFATLPLPPSLLLEKQEPVSLRSALEAD